MSTMSINTFPALNTFQSPRSWFLAIIVLLHVGFFFALNNGLSFSTLVFQPQPFEVTVVNQPDRPEEVIRRVAELDPTRWTLERIDTQPLQPLSFPTDEDAALSEGPVVSSALPEDRGGLAPKPAIIAPAIPSTGLSEPNYPASEIRAGHTGTALMSLEVLPNGQVGEVRLVRSSGYLKLDQSALREARRWRFVPGTRDGIPVTLWKQVPVTFALEQRK